MRYLLLKNFKLAENIVCPGKLSELILGKDSHDPNFAKSYSETVLFHPTFLSKLKTQKFYLEFKRLENVL
jgi:hypothetical protein